MVVTLKLSPAQLIPDRPEGSNYKHNLHFPQGKCFVYFSVYYFFFFTCRTKTKRKKQYSYGSGYYYSKWSLSLIIKAKLYLLSVSGYNNGPDSVELNTIRKQSHLCAWLLMKSEISAAKKAIFLTTSKQRSR